MQEVFPGQSFVWNLDAYYRGPKQRVRFEVAGDTLEASVADGPAIEQYMTTYPLRVVSWEAEMPLAAEPTHFTSESAATTVPDLPNGSVASAGLRVTYLGEGNRKDYLPFPGLLVWRGGEISRATLS